MQEGAVMIVKVMCQSNQDATTVQKYIWHSKTDPFDNM